MFRFWTAVFMIALIACAIFAPVKFLGFLLVALAFGTVWFWLFLTAVFIAVLAFEENDEGSLATLTLILAVVALQVFSKIPITGWVAAHPFHVLVAAVVYLPIGVAWMFFKWRLFAGDQAKKYKECVETFLMDSEIRGGRGSRERFDSEAERQNYITEQLKSLEEQYHPNIRRHKADCFRWVAYWPLSGLWFVINDPIRRFFNMVFDYCKKKLQGIADGVFASADAEVEKMKKAALTKQEEKKGQQFSR